MSSDELFWLFHTVTIPFVWYSLTAVFATNAQLCFPKWRYFAYHATGASLLFSFLIALIPYVNCIVFGLCVLFWLLSSETVSDWMTSHPLRKP
jgi:ABC-type sulfate transport system permease component